MADPVPSEEQQAADLHWRLRFLSPRSTALRIKLINDYLRAARENALEEAAKVAETACLVPPDGGSPTEDERLVCETAAARIRSLKARN